MSDDGRPTKTCTQRLHLRTACLHLGLIFTCVAYILTGAYVFQSIERPMELIVRERVVNDYAILKKDLLSNLARGVNPEYAIEEYVSKLFRIFEDPIQAHVFESHFTNYSTDKDLWTFQAATLFTTTTVIPVGYGYIWPVTSTGRILLIIYGMIGIPLALVTMADTGKFISSLVTRWFDESITVPTIVFLTLLFSYPIFGGLAFRYYTDLTFLDAIYFALTSIFTIGFGDIMPRINVIYLVFFIVFGVILVTITIDFVAAELIDHIHYMGRHVGKAKELAGKMLQMAQSLNMNRGISGLTAGMSQLQALAKMGLLGRVDKEVIQAGKKISICAFAPVLEDMDFMDRASLYASKSDLELENNDGRHLFIS